MTRVLATFLLLGATWLAAGCSTYVENEASLAFEPIYPSAHVSPEGEVPTGGIFKANGNGLFASDIRARDVGDILTVALKRPSTQPRRRPRRLQRTTALASRCRLDCQIC